MRPLPTFLLFAVAIGAAIALAATGSPAKGLLLAAAVLVLFLDLRP